jgi:hypothetical protein
VRRALFLGALAIAVPSVAAAQLRPSEAPPRISARQDTMITWAPRYRLDASAGPLGLEDQFWRRVDALPLHHRAALDATNLGGFVDLHFSGWGALDLLADSDGGVAAGDVAIGYLEVQLAPVRLWAGRRFVTFGPPGGLHVDGGGASVRSDFGLVAEAFVGRPVASIRPSLLGGVPSFEDASVAYGARIAYTDAGRVGVSTGYAELWGHGVLGSRTIDVSGYWYPGDVRFEAAAKIDAQDPGVMQARAAASYRALPELDVEAEYLHLEPSRWIPSWSILSVFETTSFDELSAAAVVRPLRALAIRAELAGRYYGSPAQSDPRLGYRAEIAMRVVPAPEPGVRLRVHLSRRDDGVVGYTIVQAGAAFDPLPLVVVSADGALAIDDAGGRESLLVRGSVDWSALDTLSVGVTLAVARTPIVPAEARAMVRASWTPEVP